MTLRSYLFPIAILLLGLSFLLNLSLGSVWIPFGEIVRPSFRPPAVITSTINTMRDHSRSNSGI